MLRRTLLLVTDPSPPLWASTVPWFLAAIILFWVAGRALPAQRTATWGPTTFGAHKTPEGEIRWAPYPGLPAEHFQATIAWFYDFRIGGEVVVPVCYVKRVPLHPRGAGPIPEADRAEVRRLAGLAMRPSPGMGQQGPDERAQGIAASLIERGLSQHVIVRPLDWVWLWARRAGALLAIICLVAGFARAAQRLWHAQRLERWSRAQCPDCGYDLVGAGSICPECGVDPAAEARTSAAVLASHPWAAPSALRPGSA